MPVPSGMSKKEKIHFIMSEFKKKNLHSGEGGPKVTNKDQAIAIALSVAKRKRK